MCKVLITGGTGFIGSHLTELFFKEGYEVAILSRNPKKENEYKWSIPENYIDEKALENTDYIIHLAGAGIADKRWTNSRKKILIDSRVKTANLLFNKVKELHINLKGFISASGIGYYGAINSEKIFTESDNPANDFIAKICIEWEKSAQQFKKLNIPVTILRTGIVLAKNKGALSKINTPLFLTTLGSGKQYMPWIHIDDLCNLYLNAIENTSFKGVFNTVAPNHKTYKSFIKILGKTIQKPVLPIHIPSFLLKILLGEMAVVLLKGSRVSAKNTEKYYQFKFSSLTTSLTHIYQ